MAPLTGTFALAVARGTLDVDRIDGRRFDAYEHLSPVRSRQDGAAQREPRGPCRAGQLGSHFVVAGTGVVHDGLSLE